MDKSNSYAKPESDEAGDGTGRLANHFLTLTPRLFLLLLNNQRLLQPDIG